MGVTESRVLAENVLTACQRAEKDGKPILDNTSLWSNEVLLSLLRFDGQIINGVWQDTCKAAKSIYRYIPQSIRGPSRQSTIKKAIMRSRKRLIIPPVIQELQDKREDLFPSGQRDVSFTAFPSQNNPLAHYYELVVQFENRLDLDRVRLRLLYVAFYRLKQDQHPGSQYEYYDPTPIAQAIFETGSIKDPLETILVKVRTWIGYGERYSLLATDLGGLGVLYILPDIAGESLWTKELPKSANHANRISIIKTLKKLGISEEARERGLHMSADAEVSQIFMSLKDSLGGRQRPPESHNSDVTQSMILHPSTDFPPPEATDAWLAGQTASSGSMTHHLPTDFPPPEATDAWLAGQTASSGSMFHRPSTDFPPPEATDAWLAGQTASSGSMFHRPSTYFPPPEATDAWPTGQTDSSGSMFHCPSTGFPPPEATDAWPTDQTASSGSMFHRPSTDFPPPEATDAWLAGQTASSGSMTHHLPTNIPPPEATDAWLAGQSTASRGFSHPLLTSNPQPDTANACVASMAHCERYLNPPQLGNIVGPIIARPYASRDLQPFSSVDSSEIQGKDAAPCTSKTFFVQGQSILEPGNPVLVM